MTGNSSLHIQATTSPRAGRTLGSDDPLGRHHFRPTLRSEKLRLWDVTCREHASSQVSPGQTGGRGFTVTLGPPGVFGRVGLPHPLPQPLSLCALGLQLLPPLGGGRVGLSQGARQLVVTVLQREELGLPLHLAHGAETARVSAEGGAGPHWAGGGARAGPGLGRGCGRGQETGGWGRPGEPGSE